MKWLIPVFALLVGCNETRIVPIPPPPNCIARDEVCNNFDDDCDGKVDEQEDLGIRPCYEGDQNNLLYGICRFGVERCVDGKWLCSGQVLPKAEACNGLDDNCNGLIDEVKGSGIDIIFAMDYSSSMADKLRMVNDILLQWSAKYANRTDIKVALVGAPTDAVKDDQKVIVMLPLSDVLTFITEARRHIYASGGGSEATLDAIYFLTDRRNPMGINWTPDYARAVFLFTDEEPQSYASPIVTEIVAMNMSIINNVNVFVFTNHPSWRSWTVYPMNSLQDLSNRIDEAIQRGMCK